MNFCESTSAPFVVPLPQYGVFLRGAMASPAEVLSGLRELSGADLLCVFEEVEMMALRPLLCDPADSLADTLTMSDMGTEALAQEPVRFFADYRKYGRANRLLVSWGAVSVLFAWLPGAANGGLLMALWRREFALSTEMAGIFRNAARYFTTVLNQETRDREHQMTQARLSSIVETMPLGVIFADYETEEAWINGPAAGFLQLPPGANSAAAVAGRMHQLREQAILLWDVESGDDFMAGAQLPLPECRGAPELPVLRVATRRLLVSGRRGRMWMLEDVSEDYRQKQSAEAALAASELRWRFALEGAGDGVWDHDLTTGRSFFSRQWKSILGYEEQEIGTSASEFRDRLHPEDRAEVLRKLEAHYRGESAAWAAQYRMRCRDGSYKWILGRGCVIHRDAAGRALRAIGTQTDLTSVKAAEIEREQLRMQFVQAQKMESLGRLAGGVAHDFNNLLTVILGYSDMLCEHLPANAEGGQFAEQIVAAGERAKALTTQLLTFGRKTDLQSQPVNLSDLVGRMEKTVLRLVGEQIRIFTVLDPALPAAMGDPNQLEQVLMNLVVNARDAMPEGGILTIRTAHGPMRDSCLLCKAPAAGSYASVSVRDTGVGMDEEVLAKLFEPFFTTKAAGQGTGLGLSVVHGIVLQNGGHITVQSKPGAGSEFCVYLPIGGEICREVKPKVVESVRGGSECILVVEDEPRVRRYTREALEMRGYRVLEASGGQEALLRLSSEAVDLMISDVMMPDMTGWQLLAATRRAFPLCRVLLVSGNNYEQPEGESVRPDGFLMKPYRPQELARRLRTLLDRDRDQDQMSARQDGA